MTIDDIKTIGVVGAGQMGRGITQVLATCGWNVLLVDVAEEVLEEAKKKLWQGVTKAVEKGPCAAIKPARPWPSFTPCDTCSDCERHRW